MVELSFMSTDPTLDAVDAAIEEKENAHPPRGYMGMSSIGHKCDRKLWNDYHWVTKRKINAEGLKRIQDGYHGEDLQAERLRLVSGITLLTNDENGRQFEFEDETGHLKGHMDGAILGLLQAPKTWHVWEHKQVNEKKQAKLLSLKEKLGEKNAIAEWDEVYYAQGILYMYYSGMTRHYLTCASPGGRKTVSVRTDHDTEYAIRLIVKAQRIAAASRPPARISNDPTWFICKSFCDHHAACHGGKLPERHCRSCLHSTPIEGGEWHCAVAEAEGCNAIIPREVQEVGCPDHRFVPGLVNGEQVHVGENERGKFIVYRMSDGAEWIDEGPQE